MDVGVLHLFVGVKVKVFLFDVAVVRYEVAIFYADWELGKLF